jgi:hypothetical protein
MVLTGVGTALADSGPASEQAMAQSLTVTLSAGAVVLILIGIFFAKSLANGSGKLDQDRQSGQPPITIVTSSSLQTLVEASDHETRSAVGQMASFVGQPVQSETSAPLVDKRKAPRYCIDRGGKVTADGTTYPVVIENISVGGIKGRGLPHLISAGSTVTVAVEGSSTTLTTSALLIKEDAQNGQFVLAPDAHSTWEQDFFKLIRDLTPVPAFGA